MRDVYCRASILVVIFQTLVSNTDYVRNFIMVLRARAEAKLEGYISK